MKRREKIFWLVLGAIYVVGLIALIPAHGEICKEGAKTGEEACTIYRLVPFLVIEIGKILDALGVAITALATIAIAWFTWSLRRSTDRLWDAGENQRLLSEDTAKRQLRAYVFVSTGEIKDQDAPDEVFCHHFEIGNAGATPAYKLRVISRTAPLSHPISAGFDFTVPIQNPSVTMLSPGEKKWHDSFAQRPLTEDEMRDAMSPAGKTRIYTYGSAFYEDCFGEKRQTDFCLYAEYHQVDASRFELGIHPAEHHNSGT